MTGGGSDTMTLMVAYGSVVAVGAFFLSTFGVYYWIEVTPALPVIAFVLMILCVINMLRATFSDPGVIPRGNIEPLKKEEKETKENPAPNVENNKPIDETAQVEIVQHNQEKEKLTEKKEEHEIKPEEKSQPNNENIDENNKPKEETKGDKKSLDITLYKYRYCSTCKIMRPPKSSHCSQCDNCVKGYDHHCNFVGNCIGERNLKYFVLFLTFGSLGCLYSLILGMIGFGLNIGFNSEIGSELARQIGFWIAGGSIIIFACVFICPNHLANIKYTLIGIGGILICIGFIIAAHEISLPYYKNPGVILGYVFLIAPYTLWLFFTLLSNLRNVFRGQTLKEKIVIEREIVDMNTKNQVFKLSWKQKCINLKDFCMKRTIKSEVSGVCL